jgi:hypothetical protein
VGFSGLEFNVSRLWEDKIDKMGAEH